MSYDNHSIIDGRIENGTMELQGFSFFMKSYNVNLSTLSKAKYVNCNSKSKHEN
jgi:hypothetical protein